MPPNLAQPIQIDTQTFSVPELRQRTISRMTGVEMGNWDFTTKPINVVCTENGVGYIKGHFYVTLNDGTLIDTFIKHNHSSATNGGTLYDMMFANTGSFIDWNKSSGVTPNDFYHNMAVGGTITHVFSTEAFYTQMFTGNVAENHAEGIVGGGRIAFASPATMQIKYIISHNTNGLLKVGVASTSVASAAGVASQMGFEWCSGANVNIGVYSADGITRQTSYLSDVVKAVPYGLRLDYYPSAKIVARNGDGMSVTHTSNLPSISAGSNSNSLFRAGVKTSNTTPKVFGLYAARLFCSSHDANFSVKGWV